MQHLFSNSLMFSISAEPLSPRCPCTDGPLAHTLHLPLALVPPWCFSCARLSNTVGISSLSVSLSSSSVCVSSFTSAFAWPLPLHHPRRHHHHPRRTTVLRVCGALCLLFVTMDWVLWKIELDTWPSEFPSTVLIPPILDSSNTFLRTKIFPILNLAGVWKEVLVRYLVLYLGYRTVQ